MKKNDYPHNCHWCKDRHWCCDYECDYKTPCKHWKMGKCLKCLYNKNGEGLNEEETARWYKRGCETFFPDAKKFCHHYIPYNKFTKWLYDNWIIK